MIQKDQNARDHSAWTIGKGDLTHELCIHPAQYTSRMETARVKQEEDKDIRIMQEQ